MSGSQPSKYRVWVAVRAREGKFPHPKERYHWQIIVEDADVGTGMFKECHTFEQHPYERGGVPEILEDFPTVVSTKVMPQYDAVIEVARFQPACLGDILNLLEAFKVNDYLPPGSSCKTFVRVVVTELKNKPARYGVLLSKDFETASKELSAALGPLQNEEPQAKPSQPDTKKFSFKRNKAKKEKSPETKERRISPKSLAQMLLPDKKDTEIRSVSTKPMSRHRPTRRRTEGQTPSISRPQQTCSDDALSPRGRQRPGGSDRDAIYDPRRAVSTPARMHREPSSRPDRPPRPQFTEAPPQIPPLEEFRFNTEPISARPQQRQRQRSRSRGRSARASSRDPRDPRQRSRQKSQRSQSRKRDATPGPISTTGYQRRKVQDTKHDDKIVVTSPAISVFSINKALPIPVPDEKIPVMTAEATPPNQSTTRNYSRRPPPPTKSQTELNYPFRMVQELPPMSPRRASAPSDELPMAQSSHLKLLGGLNSAYSPIRAMG